MNAFMTFAKAHFDPTWHLRQSPILRATLGLMADELISVARTSVHHVTDNASFRAFGGLSACAFSAAYKSMRHGILVNVLVQIGIDEDPDWIRHFAILPGESDCFEGIAPNTSRVIRAVSGRSLAMAVSDMSYAPTMPCFVARQAIFEGLCIAAQLGERAEELEARFEGDDYIRYLQTPQDLSSRLIKEAAGDMKWYVSQIAQSWRQTKA